MHFHHRETDTDISYYYFIPLSLNDQKSAQSYCYINVLYCIQLTLHGIKIHQNSVTCRNITTEINTEYMAEIQLKKTAKFYFISLFNILCRYCRQTDKAHQQWLEQTKLIWHIFNPTGLLVFSPMLLSCWLIAASSKSMLITTKPNWKTVIDWGSRTHRPHLEVRL